MMDAYIKQVFAQQNPSLARINAAMEAAAENDPALAAKVDAFQDVLKDTARSRMADVSALDTLIGNDPELYEKIHDLAVTDPSALQNIVPEALDAPERVWALLEQETGEVMTPSPDAFAALADTGPEQAAPQAQEPAAAAQDSASIQDSIGQKMAALSEIPGFDDVHALAMENPNMNRMLQTMMGDGDPAALDQSLGELLERAGSTAAERQNSQTFLHMKDFMESRPGDVTTMAGMFADQPQLGFSVFAGYSTLRSSLAPLFDGVFGEGGFDGLAIKLMGFIAPLLGQAPQLLNMSNNGGELLGTVRNVLGIENQPEVAIDPETGEASPRSATPASETAAALPDQTVDDQRRNPAAAPSMDMGPA